MNKRIIPFKLIVVLLIGLFFLSSGCHTEQTSSTDKSSGDTAQLANTNQEFGGFESQVAWGKHIVAISGCNDCHTPKKMGPNGVENNMELELSGNPSDIPAPDLARKEIESKGLVLIGGTFTSFVGPWGISYAANITSDTATGIGSWTADQFIRVFKLGKYKGSPGGRDLLPPMPWQGVGQMTDDELKAVFAYLKSTKPVFNEVPQPQPPLSAMKK